METIQIEKDIKVFYIKAKSFPEGIMEAYDTLYAKLGDGHKTRKFYGISYPEKLGKITYKAAVEEIYVGEGEALDCESFVIAKGTYLSKYIKDFMQNIPQIGLTFSEMIHRQDIDPQGFCLEEYIGDKDVRCMVKLKN